VIDAEDALLGKDGVQRRVELLGTGQVATERLLHHDAAALVEAHRSQRLRHGGEHGGWNGHVEDGVLALVLVQRLGQVGPRLRVGVVALDEIESRQQRVDDGRLRVGDAGQDGVVRVLAEAFIVPVAASHPDHRHREVAVVFQAVQRREQLALAEVAGGAEQHQRVGRRLAGGGAHCCSFTSPCP